MLFSCSESTQWRCDRTRVMFEEGGANEITIAAKIDSDAPNATVEDPYLIPIKVMIIATIQYSVSQISNIVLLWSGTAGKGANITINNKYTFKEFKSFY